MSQPAPKRRALGDENTVVAPSRPKDAVVETGRRLPLAEVSTNAQAPKKTRVDGALTENTATSARWPPHLQQVSDPALSESDVELVGPESDEEQTPGPEDHSPAVSHSAAKRPAPLEPGDSKRTRASYKPIPLDIDAPHKDLDKEEENDPLMVSEYTDEIFALMYDMQTKYIPDFTYMERQPEIKWRLRGVLVNWLVNVHSKFRLLSETLLLAVNIIDRYLEKREVGLSQLQLTGITALFIAAKYEEVFSPSVQNYSYVANLQDNDILDMERHILCALNFELGYPNPLNFVRRISKADDYDPRTRTIAKYLLDVSLVEPRLMPYRPSDIAAASMCLSLDILGNEKTWDGTYTYYSGGCTRESLMPIMAIIIDFAAAEQIAHTDFFKKYASKKYLKASILTRAFARQHQKEYPLDPETPTNLD